MKEKQIRVLMVEPMESPKLVTLQNDLDSLQKAVSIGAPDQGLIEFVYLEDNVSILCNEEGKLIGLQPNRRLGYDVLCGVFYVMGQDREGNFTSLAPAAIEKYGQFFARPEIIDPEEAEATISVFQNIGGNVVDVGGEQRLCCIDIIYGPCIDYTAGAVEPLDGFRHENMVFNIQIEVIVQKLLEQFICACLIGQILHRMIREQFPERNQILPQEGNKYGLFQMIVRTDHIQHVQHGLPIKQGFQFQNSDLTIFVADFQIVPQSRDPQICPGGTVPGDVFQMNLLQLFIKCSLPRRRPGRQPGQSCCHEW